MGGVSLSRERVTITRACNRRKEKPEESIIGKRGGVFRAALFVIESCDDYFHVIRRQPPWRRAINDVGLISKTGANLISLTVIFAPPIHRSSSQESAPRIHHTLSRSLAPRRRWIIIHPPRTFSRNWDSSRRVLCAERTEIARVAARHAGFLGETW